MTQTMTKTYQFDSRRDAEKAKRVGSLVWSSEITDHTNPESLLAVESAGPAEYNASGPRDWAKTVTYRQATREEWVGARRAEIQNKLLPALRPHWDRDKWVDGVRVECPNLDRDEIRDRAEYTALKAELDSLA